MKIWGPICQGRRSALAAEYSTIIKIMHMLGILVYVNDTPSVYIAFPSQIRGTSHSLNSVLHREEALFQLRDYFQCVNEWGEEVCYLKANYTCKKAINMNFNFHLYGFLCD